MLGRIPPSEPERSECRLARHCRGRNRSMSSSAPSTMARCAASPERGLPLPSQPPDGNRRPVAAVLAREERSSGAVGAFRELARSCALAGKVSDLSGQSVRQYPFRSRRTSTTRPKTPSPQFRPRPPADARAPTAICSPPRSSRSPAGSQAPRERPRLSLPGWP